MIDTGMVQTSRSTSMSQNSAAASELAVEFTGVGSEYFGIWIVNILLTILTLGIYYPWAKVRRRRYFYGHTCVGGEPLDFHGNPLKMLKGYLLVGVLFVLNSIAGKLSPTIALIAFLVIGSLLPALLKSSLQFRLANTSWRGLRFRFTGTLSDAYFAVLPFLLPSLIIIVSTVAVVNPLKPPSWFVLTVAAVLLAALLVIPWMIFRFKRYQQANYALGDLHTYFRATAIDFYFLFFKTFGVFLLCFVLIVALGMVAGLASLMSKAIAVVCIILIYVLFYASVGAYFTSRFQNLVWSGTGSDHLSFQSHLPLRDLILLTMKNWLLIPLTLGLYWPFARVALAHLRLESIKIHTTVDVDTVVSQARTADGDAAGDAAGDFLGLDIGF